MALLRPDLSSATGSATPHLHAWIRLQATMRVGSAAAAIRCRDLGRRGCPHIDSLVDFLGQHAPGL